MKLNQNSDANITNQQSVCFECIMGRHVSLEKITMLEKVEADRRERAKIRSTGLVTEATIYTWVELSRSFNDRTFLRLLIY